MDGRGGDCGGGGLGARGRSGGKEEAPDAGGEDAEDGRELQPPRHGQRAGDSFWCGAACSAQRGHRERVLPPCYPLSPRPQPRHPPHCRRKLRSVRRGGPHVRRGGRRLPAAAAGGDRPRRAAALASAHLLHQGTHGKHDGRRPEAGCPDGAWGACGAGIGEARLPFEARAGNVQGRPRERVHAVRDRLVRAPAHRGAGGGLLPRHPVGNGSVWRGHRLLPDPCLLCAHVPLPQPLDLVPHRHPAVLRQHVRLRGQLGQQQPLVQAKSVHRRDDLDRALPATPVPLRRPPRLWPHCCWRIGVHCHWRTPAKVEERPRQAAAVRRVLLRPALLLERVPADLLHLQEPQLPVQILHQHPLGAHRPLVEAHAR
mmetsp:Transcript_13719/g.54288  ORF Transcript_13719/g.54288 Transcript_13719/m.54288 type:complete len:370 (+) Transcript_13719:110-1219(+)